MPTYTCLTSDIYLFLPQAIFALVSEDGGGAGRLVRVDLNDSIYGREKKEKEKKKEKGSIPLSNTLKLIYQEPSVCEEFLHWFEAER